jgi:hypothetical protein
MIDKEKIISMRFLEFPCHPLVMHGGFAMVDAECRQGLAISRKKGVSSCLKRMEKGWHGVSTQLLTWSAGMPTTV